MRAKPKCLVITPINHITGIRETLESFCDVTIFSDPTFDEVTEVICNYDAIFTNPNKSKIFLGEDLFKVAPNLKVIATASTGTNHIDKKIAKARNITILSLTEERQVIEKISSTAEHAFALMMSSLRKVIKSHNDAMKGGWDYTKYIGRQMDFLTVGIVGYGRLGSLFAKYTKAFGSNIIAYDPYVNIDSEDIRQVGEIDIIARESDIISLHVHVNEETTGMINQDIFSNLKSDILIVNTSRGEIINELDLVEFLKCNKEAHYATDVISDEIRDRKSSPLFNYASENNNQVTITQHIGGMTMEAQQIAYGHAVNLLEIFFKKDSKSSKS